MAPDMFVVTLAATKPDLREEIQHITSLAWATLAWTLKQSLYTDEEFSRRTPPNPAILVDSDSIIRHVNLLGTFLHASGEDPEKLRTSSLLEELSYNIKSLKNMLKEREQYYLWLYDEVYCSVCGYCGYSAPEQYAKTTIMDLVFLADNCFEIMTHLDGLE